MVRPVLLYLTTIIVEPLMTEGPLYMPVLAAPSGRGRGLYGHDGQVDGDRRQEQAVQRSQREARRVAATDANPDAGRLLFGGGFLLYVGSIYSSK